MIVTFNNQILFLSNKDSEYDQDQGTQRGGGLFSSRNPAASDSGKK